MAALLNEIEDEVSMPQQVLHNIIAMFAKPAGGERPIAVTAYPYAWYMGCRKSLAVKWDNEKKGFWDDAVRKSSALQATLRRKLRDEVEVLNGGCVVSVFYDLEKFYDTIDIKGLIGWARERDFHLGVLALAM